MPTPNFDQLQQTATQIRRLSLEVSTQAGSGHPTSSLSATDLMTVLLFSDVFQSNWSQPKDAQADKLIFSKGHASPLFYSLFTELELITKEELLSYRQFQSRLEGHPTMQFPYTVAATGSLGQGLSIGLGLSLAAKLNNLSTRSWVLVGDSEIAEGSVWEAVQLASYYQTNNLIAVVDINRLGQSRATMYGHDIQSISSQFQAFGWSVHAIDGHNLKEIYETYQQASNATNTKPQVILAKTLKGKGVSFLEDKEGWHGKALDSEQLHQALRELT